VRSVASNGAATGIEARTEAEIEAEVEAGIEAGTEAGTDADLAMESGATLGAGRVSRAESDSSDGSAGAADGTADEMRADTRRRDTLATRSLMAVFSAGAESLLDLLRRFPSCFNMSLRAMGLVFDSLYLRVPRQHLPHMCAVGAGSRSGAGFASEIQRRSPISLGSILTYESNIRRDRAALQITGSREPSRIVASA
jgi:hypothetical protein